MRYQIKSIKREYDTRHELTDATTGCVVRGPIHTRDAEPPSYMVDVQRAMNAEAGADFTRN